MTPLEGWSLVSAADGTVCVERLEVADVWRRRLVGLQFRRTLPAGNGLLLVPCGSIHTCFLRFPIDAVGLDSQGVALAVGARIAPWRTHLFPKGTHAVLEMPAGACRLRPGDRLQLVGPGDASVPKSLAFLTAGRTA